MRIGQGFDAHRFASHDAGKPLWLACLRWDGDGIEGDSDGDVAAHALIDALLSAAGLGDIGMLFGVGSDSAGAGKHGDEMLRATVAYLRAHGMRPVSASVVVVANRPKIGKRRHVITAIMAAGNFTFCTGHYRFLLCKDYTSGLG